MVLAVPAEAGPGARRVRLAAALQRPLIVFPRALAPSLFDLLMGLYRTHGITPSIVQEANQMQTIVNLVSAGMGVAWVPESMTRLQRPGVDYCRLPSAGLACETSLIWREPAAPVVLRFVRHVAGAGALPLTSDSS